MESALRSQSLHDEIIRNAVSSSAAGRSTLAASWQRSLKLYALDPQSRQRRPRLDSSRLSERREQSEKLLRSSDAAVSRLATLTIEPGTGIFLSDNTGMIVNRRTRQSDNTEFDLLGLAVGADWSEESEGTNAIGICLFEGRANTIWQDQHFFARNLPLVCIGAPIEAPDATLAGVLNLSACRGDITEIQARLTAFAVQAAALQISTALFHAEFERHKIITLANQHGAGAALVAVDQNELVVGANRLARRSLALSASKLRRCPPLSDILPEANRVGANLAIALRSEVIRALKHADGNVAQAARDLGIGRATLYRKMTALGLEWRKL
ncbi:helix-turn-helix domain-containing protein [Ochrobactrum sp. Marseille-Q0166]|uniref:helix-turn-helix domain-containing protein n=1 Tax=Ochrobactrum sp. Marseille-Q0166 TaxID=2761105 RepID=UPI00165574ED|nr:helix-turn-helix domain-containing protein [Ochrobactrum sp. Marseille-Q0166]MBC8719666.1 sigma-54-dependent Fis family transcriptional regulator [Ochrobactrum sp. Marseille-Q0166]